MVSRFDQREGQSSVCGTDSARERDSAGSAAGCSEQNSGSYRAAGGRPRAPGYLSLAEWPETILLANRVATEAEDLRATVAIVAHDFTWFHTVLKAHGLRGVTS